MNIDINMRKVGDNALTFIMAGLVIVGAVSTFNFGVVKSGGNAIVKAEAAKHYAANRDQCTGPVVYKREKSIWGVAGLTGYCEVVSVNGVPTEVRLSRTVVQRSDKLLFGKETAKVPAPQ